MPNLFCCYEIHKNPRIQNWKNPRNQIWTAAILPRASAPPAPSPACSPSSLPEGAPDTRPPQLRRLRWPPPGPPAPLVGRLLPLLRPLPLLGRLPLLLRPPAPLVGRLPPLLRPLPQRARSSLGVRGPGAAFAAFAAGLVIGWLRVIAAGNLPLMRRCLTLLPIVLMMT